MTDTSIPPDPPEDSEVTLEDLFGPDLSTLEDVSLDTPSPDEPIEEGSFFEDATIPIGDGSCSVCGAPTFRPPGLTKTGRKKRAPKYCDLHDPKRRISTEGPFTSSLESQLQKIQDELGDDIRLLGVLVGPLFPVTGYYLMEHADPFTVAILKLAKNNQKVLRVLHRAAQVAPIYTVAETVAGTALSIQVDQQKADPHSMAAHRLGVERAYLGVYPDKQVNVNGNSGFQGPPRYASAH